MIVRQMILLVLRVLSTLESDSTKDLCRLFALRSQQHTYIVNKSFNKMGYSSWLRESITIVATITPRMRPTQQHKCRPYSRKTVSSLILPFSSSPIYQRSIVRVAVIFMIALVSYTTLRCEFSSYDRTSSLLTSKSSEMMRIIQDSENTSSKSTSSIYFDDKNETKTIQLLQAYTSNITTIITVRSTNTVPEASENSAISLLEPNSTNSFSTIDTPTIENPVNGINTNQSSTSKKRNVSSAIVVTQIAFPKWNVSLQSYYVPEPNWTSAVELPVLEVVTPIVFPKWSVSVPCYVPEPNWKSAKVQGTPTDIGILYLKTHKTGSSTSAGINLRIARNLAKRQWHDHKGVNQPNGMEGYYDACHSRFQHGRAATLFPNRTIQKYNDLTSDHIDHQEQRRSVLWTILRDPTARCVSSFFHFAVSRHGVTPTDTNFTNYVKQRKISVDYYLRFLYTKNNFTRQTMHENIDNTPQKVINSILNTYDFIGIMERMDESAVVLMMLLNLRMSDILYLRSKSKGGYDGGGGGTYKACTLITPSSITPAMRYFFRSNQWKKLIKYDQELYNAVNTSLDMTIDFLGRTKFMQQLARFRFALRTVESQCRNTTIFPCDAMGKSHNDSETDCLWSDSGCGTKCIDNVSTQLDLW
jgi:Galactose-3-O-sulfotransferase